MHERSRDLRRANVAVIAGDLIRLANHRQLASWLCQNLLFVVTSGTDILPQLAERGSPAMACPTVCDALKV